MGPLGALAVVGAGFAAGTINTVVGSGSLITYPVLVALGYSPLVANVSNTIGLAPGSVSGSIGYRRELVGQRSRMLHLGGVRDRRRPDRRLAAAGLHPRRSPTSSPG